jgi:hypothetical protein
MRYMLIHCIDEADEHWLGTIEVRPINDRRCDSPEEAV